jgi:hypothetical protein
MNTEEKTYAQKLLSQYLELYKKRSDLGNRLNALKTELTVFTKTHKIKKLSSSDASLSVVIQKRTEFPDVSEKGRDELEKIMRNSKELDFALGFDIVKLSIAFDENRLSKELRDKLLPFAKSKEVVRIIVKD